MNKTIGLVALSSLLAVNTAFAEDDKKEWEGSADVGIVIANGNTDTKSTNAKVSAVREVEKWRHHLEFSSSSKSDNDNTTAEKYFAEGKIDRKFSESYYIFTLVNYEKDRFSGFDHQAVLSAGAGRRAFEDANMTLDAELGIGVRFNETDAGVTDEEPVLRVAADFNWDISDTSAFQQTLSIEGGDEATITKSLTSLTAKINDNGLSMKASFETKHTSEVPAGTKRTDTTTTLGLTYTF